MRCRGESFRHFSGGKARVDHVLGEVYWEVKVGEHKTAYSITHAPLAIKDRVIVGVAGAEYGIRGFLDAYDAKSGKRVWRFWWWSSPRCFSSAPPRRRAAGTTGRRYSRA